MVPVRVERHTSGVSEGMSLPSSIHPLHHRTDVLNTAPSLAAPSHASLSCEQRTVPLALWLPDRPCRALVLASHGGGGHKESAAIQTIVAALLPLGCAVAAIDGPVHGARRADGSVEPAVVRADFRQAWRDGVGRQTMVDDWKATLDHLQRHPALAHLPVGYVGVSMGTAYGLPLLAQEPRITASVLGLWSHTHVSSAHLVDAARSVTSATWFTQCWDDEIFDRQGTIDLFDALGSSDKQLVVYPGPHAELYGERMADAASFLSRRLLRSDVK